MEFNNAPPEWENKGAEPGEDLKKQGFLAGYKPPAAYFNWFWNKTSACIKELQEKLKGITKSDVGLDKVDNKSLEEILTEVTMDKANAKDTSGLVGAAQENVKAQQLLDELANRVATKVVEKGMIANNLTTTNPEMVLAAPMGKELKRQLDEQNNNKINLYVGETLPEIRDRNKKTIYCKVTDTISASNTTENIKVSPLMGIKLVNN